MPTKTRKILYIDMDNVLVDFPRGIALLEREVRECYRGRYDEVPGIFALMPPMPGAIAAYRTLAEHFDTYILSTAPWRNASAWSDKVLWVRKHLGDVAYKRLILTHHKELQRGDFLVDDRAKNGAEDFKGEWLQFGSERFPGWDAVCAYLVQRA